MRRRVLLTVAVAVLAAAAGCNAVLGDGGGESTPEETLTPAPVPEVTPTPERWPVAPGVSGAGVVDVDVLVAAHLDFVSNRSYTWRAERGARILNDSADGQATPGTGGTERGVATETTGDGSATETTRSRAATETAAGLPAVETSVETVARVAGPTSYSAWTIIDRIQVRGIPTYVANYSEYADGESRYLRYRHLGDDRPTTERDAVVAAGSNQVIGEAATSAVRRYLTGGDATVAETRHDGRPHYEVVVRDRPVPVADETRYYEARALVSPDGFVRSLNVSYVIVSDGVSRAVAYSFAYTDVNETTVDEPAWVAEQRDP